MTPDVMNMIMNLQAEKEKKAQQPPGAPVVSLFTPSMTTNQDPHEDNSAYDWTSTYRKWDTWEAQELRASAATKEREQYERALAKGSTSCNHDHSAEQRLMDLSTREQLDESSSYHRLGNAFVEEGQFPRAGYYYHKALLYFEYMFPEEDELELEGREMDRQKLKLMLNFAKTEFQLERLDQVINYCSQALKLEPGCVKALYRRAKAYRVKDDFPQALQDLQQALALAPGDVSIRRELKILQAKKRAYHRESKHVGQAMFRRHVSDNSKGEKANANPRETVLPVWSLPRSETSPRLQSWNPLMLGQPELDLLLLLERQEPTETIIISN